MAPKIYSNLVLPSTCKSFVFGLNKIINFLLLFPREYNFEETVNAAIKYSEFHVTTGHSKYLIYKYWLFH